MRLVAFDLTDRDPELVADRCWQAGAAGLWEVDATTLRAGVEDEDLAAFLSVTSDLGPLDVTTEEAVELADRRSTVAFGRWEIDLWVPATVFGDGHHPTTATCLSVLADLVTSGTTVLDVGCGTGALAIGAALLGGRVTAVDIDADAVAVTVDNAIRNRVDVDASTRALTDVDRRFDVVVANMTTGSLTPLLTQLVRSARPGGVLVVSGLLEDQWPPVRDAVAGEPGRVEVVDGWVTAAITVP